MIQIKNTAKVPCSEDNCSIIIIANKKRWLCPYHFKLWMQQNSKQGSKNWFNKNQKPIRKRSLKGQVLDKKYSRIRKEFLSLPENKICPVENKPAIEIHHKMGKEGFADVWARQNNIPLLIDVRFFLAVSRDGHNKIEANPKWAKENGYSIKRVINIYK